jgi:16S rRNA (cytosine1402-N4)-methyltransferase
MPESPSFNPTLRDISGAVKAGAQELAENPRARSAVLRIAEKLELQDIGDRQ